jgi:nitroreductase
MIRQLILKNRSYRRFYEEKKISEKTLRELVDLARLSACAANIQPLKFMLSFDAGRNELIFKNLSWAGYLKDWPGPAEGEKPAGYIIILGDRQIDTNFYCDHGIAAQSILLGAVEKGLGGCILGVVNRDGLAAAMKIPQRYEILLVIALGVPKEKVVIENVGAKGSIKYWRDEDNVHHVPKRSLDELIIG